MRDEKAKKTGEIIFSVTQNLTCELPQFWRDFETVRVVLPFKDQPSANYVKQQLNNLSSKLNVTVQPVFVSPKLEQQLKRHEFKPPIVNQQCLVYEFKFNLCDAGYVG